MTRQMVDIDGGPIPKGRVSKRLEKGIRLIEEEGFSIAQAAESVGYATHSLTQALRKPHVRAFRADVKRAWRNSESAKSWRTVAELRDKAASEKVRLEAARTFLQAEGELKPEGQEQGQGAPTIIIQQAETINNGAPQLAQRTPGVWQAPEVIEAKAREVDE